MTKLIDNENQYSTTSEPHYITILSCYGLIMPSESLSNDIARTFAILDLSSDVIGRSSVPSRKAGTSRSTWILLASSVRVTLKSWLVDN